MSSLLRLTRKQKKFNPSRIRIILFLSFYFGIETIKLSYTPVVPSKTILDSIPKWAKCVLFETKKAQKPYLLGRHAPIWLE